MMAGAGGRGPARVSPRRVGVVNSRDAVVYVSILMSTLFFFCVAATAWPTLLPWRCCCRRETKLGELQHLPATNSRRYGKTSYGTLRPEDPPWLQNDIVRLAFEISTPSSP